MLRPDSPHYGPSLAFKPVYLQNLCPGAFTILGCIKLYDNHSQLHKNLHFNRIALQKAAAIDGARAARSVTAHRYQARIQAGACGCRTDPLTKLQPEPERPVYHDERAPAQNPAYLSWGTKP